MAWLRRLIVGERGPYPDGHPVVRARRVEQDQIDARWRADKLVRHLDTLDREPADRRDAFDHIFDRKGRS
jgi:hypothetical protein